MRENKPDYSVLEQFPSSPNPNPKERYISNFVFWNRTRIFVLLLSLSCLALTQINSQIFTFTVICMKDLVEEHKLSNLTSEPHWIEKNTEKSILFASGAIGAVIGLIPSVPLINRYGARRVLSVCGVFSTLGTSLIPFAVSQSFYLVVLCRIFQGIGVSPLLTVLGVIPASWAPNSEYGYYMSTMSCAWQLSNVIFMPISGVLCNSSMGWRSIYYLFGGLTGFFFTVFFWFYEDHPNIHKNVSEKELVKISSGKVEQAAVREAVPYLKICTDSTVLAAWIFFFGGNLGFIVLLFYGPTYLSEVLHFNVKETGFINALPYVITIIYKFSVGKLSDKITFVSEKTIYTCWLFAATFGMNLGYIIMAFTSNRMVAFGAFFFAIVASGCVIMGTMKCLQMRCQQHTHFASCIVSFITYLVQFIAPIGVRLVCPDGTPEQWSRLFILITLIMTLVYAPFPFLTTQKHADFTRKKEVVEVVSSVLQ